VDRGVLGPAEMDAGHKTAARSPRVGRMKIDPKTGDDGTTGLFGGERTTKDAPRVAAYGTVDELNAQIGAVRALGLDPDFDRSLSRVQNELFVLGADLATPPGAKASDHVRRVAPSDAAWLEQEIDVLAGGIPALTSFILPGGAPAAASVHVARAVCRRAERAVVALARAADLGPGPIVYLNRLADYLFTLARAINHRTGNAEQAWKP
jgi:cob(I)alamin adenosyltransferase